LDRLQDWQTIVLKQPYLTLNFFETFWQLRLWTCASLESLGCHFKLAEPMIRVPYIQVELVYRFHKPEWFHAMIDTRSDVTMASVNSYPERYWKELHKPLQVVVASGQIAQLTKAVFGQFIAILDSTTGQHKIMPLPTVVIQAPKDATYNLLLGVDFLKQFQEYYSNHSQINFLTPCGH